jgi:dissimilatory sulfite reductase (desulfoviridin) alpha/beta subunit
VSKISKGILVRQSKVFSNKVFSDKVFAATKFKMDKGGPMTTPFKLANGAVMISTEAPGGVYTATQLKKIASLCDGQVALVKATEDQRLALAVSQENAEHVAQELQMTGLGIRHYQDGLHQPTACLGELCPDKEQDALTTAVEISTKLAEVETKSCLKIGVNGCSKCCVPCHTLDISVIGDSSGYKMHLGGKNSVVPEMATFMAEGVPAEEVSNLIASVISIYNQHNQGDESLQNVIERIGATEFIQALAPYSQDAAGGGTDPFETVASGPTSNDLPNNDDTGANTDANTDANTETSSELNTADELFESSSDTQEELAPIAMEPETFPEDLPEDQVFDATQSAELDEQPGETEAVAASEESELSVNNISDSDIQAMSLDEILDEHVPTNENQLNKHSAEEPHVVDLNFEEISPSMGSATKALATDISINVESDFSPDIEMQPEIIEEGPTNDDQAMVAVESTNDTHLSDSNDSELTNIELHEAELIEEPQAHLGTEGTETTDTTDTTHTTEASNLSTNPDRAVTSATSTSTPAEEETTSVDEDAFEDKISASIKAQEEFNDVSDDSDNRINALDAIAASAMALDDDADQVENIADDHLHGTDENDIEILDYDAAIAQQKDYEEELNIPEYEEAHLPLSEMVKSQTKTLLDDGDDGDDTNSFLENETHQNADSKSWHIAGVDIDTKGSPILTFSNGVELTISNNTVARGHLTIGGQTIKLNDSKQGLEVSIEGMKLVVPRSAA